MCGTLCSRFLKSADGEAYWESILGVLKDAVKEWGYRNLKLERKRGGW